MTEFNFTSPDGREYNVTGPEGATPEQAFQILQSHLGDTAKSSVGVGEDLVNVAKSAPGRLVGGVAGIPGDLYHMGLRALGDNLTPESDYGSNSIMKSLGSDYKAQTEPGRLTQKGIDFAPAVIGGPEALGARLLTRVAAPAVASEAGGALGGPVGELAGALGGAASATAAARKFQAMAAARNAPGLTAEKVLETAGNQFNQSRDMNVIVKPDFATNAAADMRASIKGYDPNVVKDVHAAADRLEALGSSKPSIAPGQRLQAEMNWEPLPAIKTTPVAMNDAEFIRKELVSLKTSPDASVRSAAKEAIKSLQKSQMALTAADTLSGDAAAFRDLTSQAVGNWAKGKQAQTVLGKIGNAELASATAGSGANQDNNMRQAMKQLARNVNNTNMPNWKKQGFSDAAGAAIDQAARGTTFGNVMRGIGKGAPTGVVSAAGGLGIGHMAGGPVGAVALPAVGYIAKKIGDLSTKRAANAITSLVLSESPLAAHVAAQLPPQIIRQMPAKAQRVLQKLILADPPLRSAQQPSQPVGHPATY